VNKINIINRLHNPSKFLEYPAVCMMVKLWLVAEKSTLLLE